jgi:hypothetical protein
MSAASIRVVPAGGSVEYIYVSSDMSEMGGAGITALL